MNPQLWLLAAAVLSTLQAAELAPVTLAAWDQSVRSADAAMQDRLKADESFLWVDENPQRRREVRAGEILVTPVGEHNPKKVPNGLVHHWMGAAFLPDARIADVLAVVRDYAHYKDYYYPTVVDSKTISQAGDADRFSTLLLNKALFLKTALENECESSYIQVAPNRWYSTATTVRVQEIQDYGQPAEHKLPSDEGSGIIWRLHSITRYEEADGGVYLEIEAMALSREIPAGLRWVVDPIVRRVSKGSLITSLKQTQEAMGASTTQITGRVTSGKGPALSSGFAPTAARH